VGTGHPAPSWAVGLALITVSGEVRLELTTVSAEAGLALALSSGEARLALIPAVAPEEVLFSITISCSAGAPACEFLGLDGRGTTGRRLGAGRDLSLHKATAIKHKIIVPKQE